MGEEVRIFPYSASESLRSAGWGISHEDMKGMHFILKNDQFI